MEDIIKLKMKDYRRTAELVVRQEFEKQSGIKTSERMSLLAACGDTHIAILCQVYLEIIDPDDEEIKQQLEENLKFYGVEII